MTIVAGLIAIALVGAGAWWMLGTAGENDAAPEQAASTFESSVDSRDRGTTTF